jgi:hypothetical protein
MLPTAYETPVAVALVLGGAIACFAGYRLFRVVLAIYGFIAGALLASSIMASSSSIGMVLAALAGGIVGSLILFFAYFVAIALVGAGLGALVVRSGWPHVSGGEPPVVVVLIFVAIGAAIAVILQRYVIIVTTAFAGSWTVVLGALTLTAGRRAVQVRTMSDVWVLYPFSPGIYRRSAIVAWVILGLVGTVVQLGTTSRRKRR